MARRYPYPTTVVFFLLTIFLFSCEGGSGTTDPIDNGGGDSIPVVEGRPKGDYQPHKNMIDPQRVEFFSLFTRQAEFPFNNEALVAMGISRMVIRQYTANENDLLEENSTEEELIAAKVFDFGFNQTGGMASYKRVASILGDPADSTSLSWVYGEDRKPDFVNIVSATGKTAGIYSYTEIEGKRKVNQYQDPEGISIVFQEDETTGRNYETHYDASGGGFVTVYGPEGSFSDQEVQILHEEILERASPFVDYGSAGSLKKVLLIEGEKDHPLKMMELAELGSREGTSTYLYTDKGILRRIDFKGESGLKTETRFTYNEFGDLMKISFNEDNPDAGNLTVVQKFQYDEKGRFIRRIRTKKVGLGSLDLDRIDIVSYD